MFTSEMQCHYLDLGVQSLFQFTVLHLQFGRHRHLRRHNWVSVQTGCTSNWVSKSIYSHCAAFACYSYTPDRLLTSDAIIKFVFAAFLHAFIFHTLHRTAGSNYHRSTMFPPCSTHSTQAYFGLQRMLFLPTSFEGLEILPAASNSSYAKRRSLFLTVAYQPPPRNGQWKTAACHWSDREIHSTLSSQIKMPTGPHVESRKRKEQRCMVVPFVSYIVIMISSFQKTKDNGI